MGPPPDPQEQEKLLREILGKIPSIHDPDHLLELFGLGLELILRRPEDRTKKEALVKSICNDLDAAREETVPSKFFAAVSRAAQHCVALLQKAKDERTATDAEKQHPAIGEEQTPAPDSPAPAPPPRRTPLRWSVITLATLVVAASASAVLALATHAYWKDFSFAKRQSVLTAAQLTNQILNAASNRPESMSLSDAGIKLHVIRDAKDQAMFVIEAVPRRICPASGWTLAQKGNLTINGTAPANRSKSAITALCYRSEGPSIVTWSPNPL